MTARALSDREAAEAIGLPLRAVREAGDALGVWFRASKYGRRSIGDTKLAQAKPLTAPDGE